jgi:hypothetical protein
MFTVYTAFLSCYATDLSNPLPVRISVARPDGRLGRFFRLSGLSVCGCCDVVAAFPWCNRSSGKGCGGSYKADTFYSWYSDWLRAGRLSCQSSSPDGDKNFHFSMTSRPAPGPIQPPIQWVPGSLSTGLKGPGHEVKHSLPTSGEVKKTWV